MGKKKVSLAALTAVLVLLLTFLFFGPAISPNSQVNSRVSRQGTIKAVGINIYSDSSLNTTLYSIDWGILPAGASENFTCYIQNTGSSSTTLELATSNWNPPTASHFVTLNWDYAGSPIVPTGVAKVTFTLGIAANISAVTNFSFDTVITGIRV